MASLKFLLKRISLLPFLFIVLLNCEEYLGFNYSADEQPNYTRIQGVIKNVFTGEPVFEATVKVGDRASVTDIEGKYLIYHDFGTDQERDKPVDFSVSAKNYYGHSSEILLAPFFNRIDFDLTYAAPIIQDYYWGWHYSSDNTRLFLVQAKVMDYQGVDTIDSVRITYTITNDSIRASIYRKMVLIRQIDENTAFYQRYIDPTIFSDFRLLETFDLEAFDNEGFSGFETRGPYPKPLLFEPVLP